MSKGKIKIRDQVKIEEGFHFWYIIKYLENSLAVPTDTKLSEIIGYSGSRGLIKTYGKILPVNIFDAENVARNFYTFMKEKNYGNSKEIEIREVFDRLINNTPDELISENVKKDICSVIKFEEYLKRVLEEAFIKTNQDEDYTMNCDKCKKIKELSKLLHDYEHELRNEFFLMPYITYTKKVHKSSKPKMFREQSSIYAQQFSNIIQTITTYKSDVAIDMITQQDQIPLDKEIYCFEDMIPYCDILSIAQTDDEPLSPLIEHEEYIKIINSKKSELFTVVSSPVRYSSVIVPIRINTLISPYNITNTFKTEPCTPQQLKKQLSNKSIQQVYEILGFVNVKIYGIINSDMERICVDMAKMFSDSLYKYIERVRYNMNKLSNVINKI